MRDRFSLIPLDPKPNRHSLNALLGALETDPAWAMLDVRLPADEAALAAQLAEVLAAGNPAVVGLSLATLQAARVAAMLARLQPSVDRKRVLWIAGGPHPTADPRGVLQMGFDAVVCGEGEATLLDLLHAVHQQRDLASVAGLALPGTDATVCYTACRPPIDLDRFPPFPLTRRMAGAIEITRGCPFACGYCQTSHLLGRQPRHRSVDSVLRYVAAIRRRKLRDVRVITPNAFSYGSPDGRRLNLPALETLLAGMRQALGPEGRLFFGTFPSEVRPEHVNEQTLALVRRYAANDSLLIGAQSGSDRMLRRCGRGHTVADVFAAVAGTLAVGLRPHVDFIFGLPGETPADVQATLDAIRTLAAAGALIHAHTFLPLPQTAFAAAPAGRIPGRLRETIRELIHAGALYGVWDRQQRAAQEIARTAQES